MTTMAPTQSATGRQRTVAGRAVVSGIGLFTGEASTATILPGDAGTGVVFIRSDIAGSEPIPARLEHVSPAPRRTVLERGSVRVETVEHCLSALAGLGIDNARIEVNGPELPAGDGSASAFVEAIERTGYSNQAERRAPIVVREPITVRDGEASITALPDAPGRLEVVYDLDYGPHSPIERQLFATRVDASTYTEQIAPARTFALAEEAQAMRERGMFAHLSPRDVLVIDADGPIENEFRFTNEPARHKALDLIGDLSLAGRPIEGKIVASRSGHALNHALARALIARDAGAGEGTDSEATGGETPSETTPAMDIRRILRLLPHRYPMVLVDRVLEIEGDSRAIGVKNVTINEPFFQGHYPVSPIMPGVLIVEAMSQLAGLMLSQKLERTGKVAVLLSLENVKLRRAVVPGDQLILHAEAVRATSRFGECNCRAMVGQAVAAEAKVKFMMVDAEQD